jgi:hypothetical protein
MWLHDGVTTTPRRLHFDLLLIDRRHSIECKLLAMLFACSSVSIFSEGHTSDARPKDSLNIGLVPHHHWNVDEQLNLEDHQR